MQEHTTEEADAGTQNLDGRSIRRIDDDHTLQTVPERAQRRPHRFERDRDGGRQSGGKDTSYDELVRKGQRDEE